MARSSVQLLAPAKVNLFLELLSRRTDGFHDLETIMVAIDLHDRIVIQRRKDSRLTLACRAAGRHPLPNMPMGPENLVYRAADLLRREAGVDDGFDLILEKRIPIAAGLGGGSSDAAATLIGLSRLLELHWPRNRLAELGARIGSDVPFFLHAPMALCRGRGERVYPLASPSRCWLVMATPPSGLSTVDVFQKSDVPSQPRSAAAIHAALAAGDCRRIGPLLFNRLQAAARSLNPWITSMRQAFAGTRSLGHQMSGSGSSYFGVFANRATARRAVNLLRARLPEVRFMAARVLGNLFNKPTQVDPRVLFP